MQSKLIRYEIAVVESYETTSDRGHRSNGCGLRVLSSQCQSRDKIGT